MKRVSAPVMVLVFTAITTSLMLSSVFGSNINTPGFTVARMVVSEGIEDREPVGITDTFPSLTKKVYCFLEAGDIAWDTSVSFVWYYGESEMAKVNLPLREGFRWRTYSSKQLAGLRGNWKVELQDTDGAVLKTVEFKVE